MKKYRLDLNDLDVVSFDAVPDAPSRKGTVFGHATEFTACTCDYANTCHMAYTCDLQCGGGGDSMYTACLSCYTNADTCTMIGQECNFTFESCLSCACS